MKKQTLDAIVADAVSKIERDAIVSSLKRNDRGNGKGPDIGAVAEELGLARSTLWRKMKQYDLRRRVMVEV